MSKKNANALLRTTGGRIAGDGVVSDDYSEESGNKSYEKHIRENHTKVRFPHDGLDPSALNGPVIIVKKGNKK